MVSPFFMILTTLIFIFVLCTSLSFSHNLQAEGTVGNAIQSNISDVATDKSTLSSENTFVMINTTSLTNCISSDILKLQNNYGKSRNSSNEFIGQLKDSNKFEIFKLNNSTQKGVCKIFSISESVIVLGTLYLIVLKNHAKQILIRTKGHQHWIEITLGKRALSLLILNLIINILLKWMTL